MSTTAAAPIPSALPDNSARAETNRLNAQASTGPRTPEGKQSVRLNALRHGLYAMDVVLPGEDRSAYEGLGRMLASAYPAATDRERHLLQSLHNTEWQIIRVRALETNFYALGVMREMETMEFDSAIDLATRQALAGASGWEKNSRQFEQLSKQLVRLSRLREKSINELTALIQARHAQEAQERQQAKSLAASKPASPQSPAQNPTGFVPSNSAQPRSNSAPAPQPGQIHVAPTPHKQLA